MNKLIYSVVGVLMLTACVAPMETPSARPSEKQAETRQPTGGDLAARWRVVGFSGFSERDLADKNAFLDLSNMPKAYGSMGCNNLMFQAETDGKGRIDFGAIAATRMLCEDMKLEEAFSRMKSVWQYRFDGGDLILEQNGKTMRLRRQ